MDIISLYLGSEQRMVDSASLSENARTASYSISSSWAPQPDIPTSVASASWASSSLSASYVPDLYPQVEQISASWASASISASYVPNLYSQTVQVSASWASASLSASYVPNLYPQTTQVSCSWASASFSASYAPPTTQISCSWASQSLSSSYANTLNANNNYLVNALTASIGLLIGPGADRDNIGLYVSASSRENSSIVEVDDAYGNEVLTIGPSGSFATTNYQLTGSYTTTYTDSYTISNLDDGKLVVINSGSTVSVTLTTSSINPCFNSMFYQSGSGQIQFVTASTSVVLRNRQTQYKSAGQYAMVSVIRVPDGSFILGGDTSA